MQLLRGKAVCLGKDRVHVAEMVGQMAERQARLLRDLSGGQACIAVPLDAAEGGGSDLGATIFGGLILGRRVPPRIEVKHVAGPCQVKSGAASLSADTS